MGWIVGFYPVETAVTAGLCMTNMGGAGDLAVLGAAKRMDLICFAQISSRIGAPSYFSSPALYFQLYKKSNIKRNRGAKNEKIQNSIYERRYK